MSEKFETFKKWVLKNHSDVWIIQSIFNNFEKYYEKNNLKRERFAYEGSNKHYHIYDSEILINPFNEKGLIINEVTNKIDAINLCNLLNKQDKKIKQLENFILINCNKEDIEMML